VVEEPGATQGPESRKVELGRLGIARPSASSAQPLHVSDGRIYCGTPGFRRPPNWGNSKLQPNSVRLSRARSLPSILPVIVPIGELLSQ